MTPEDMKALEDILVRNGYRAIAQAMADNAEAATFIAADAHNFQLAANLDRIGGALASAANEIESDEQKPSAISQMISILED